MKNTLFVTQIWFLAILISYQSSYAQTSASYKVDDLPNTFLGVHYTPVPILEMIPLEMNEKYDTWHTSTITKSASEGCFMFDKTNLEFWDDYHDYPNEDNEEHELYDDEVIEIEACDKGFTTWWMPNLQTIKDENYGYDNAFEFIISFTPEKTASTKYNKPIQIILGNSPSGFITILIDQDGSVSLGTDSFIVYTIPGLNGVKWNEKNLIRFQGYENGVYELNVNGAIFSEETIGRLTGKSSGLGPLVGISNRLLVNAGLKIDYLYLGMCQLDARADIRTYNGFDKKTSVDICEAFIKYFDEKDQSAEVIIQEPFFVATMEYTESTICYVGIPSAIILESGTANSILLVYLRLNESDSSIYEIGLSTWNGEVKLPIEELESFYSKYLSHLANLSFKNDAIYHNGSR